MVRESISEKEFPWQVEVLRLTVFPGPTPFQIENSWQDLVGEPPDSTTVQPKEGVSREEGSAFGAKLVLLVQPTRIDWVFVSAEAPTDLIGNFQDVLAAFVPPMQKWLAERSPAAQRLAFGAVLELPVESKLEGYAKLASYLHDLKLDPEKSADLLYQINRPRPTKVEIPDLQINRLGKWSVGFIQQAILSVSPGVATSVRDPRFHCRLEMDINTGADFRGEFDNKQQTKLFEELVALALEISEKGDIP